MRIIDLEKRTEGELAVVAARVLWEDCGKPASEIHIAVPAEHAADLTLDAHAFLIGALIPALHFGERRVAMQEAVCPQLKQGLSTVMGVMQHWSGGRFQPLRLEMPTASEPLYIERRRRTGLFLSGGIDSLATLRLNHLRFPEGHPRRVQDGLIVHGFDIGGVVARGAKYPVFERARAHLVPVARDAAIELIPIYTNIRHLCDERDLWLTYFFGAVLAACAHALAPRLHLADIAASYDIAHLAPCGSHPLLDPAFSSSNLQIQHCDVERRRMDKLRLIAEWPAALHNMRVCLANDPGRLNCGRCEKCVRTMTGLAAIDALRRTRAFEEDDVAPELFDGFKITIRHREPFYLEMLEPLRRQGRHDLAELIASKLQEPPA